MTTESKTYTLFYYPFYCQPGVYSLHNRGTV